MLAVALCRKRAHIKHALASDRVLGDRLAGPAIGRAVDGPVPLFRRQRKRSRDLSDVGVDLLVAVDQQIVGGIGAVAPGMHERHLAAHSEPLDQLGGDLLRRW